MYTCNFYLSQFDSTNMVKSGLMLHRFSDSGELCEKFLKPV